MSPPRSIQFAPTLLGLGAVALWSLLATLTLLAGNIPPFQMTAMTFALGTAVGLGYMYVTRQPLAGLKAVPFGAHALGVYGLLGFHTCYFFALQNAPPLDVSLIMYLWPLMIVLFTGLLPGGQQGDGLRWWHVAGALLGFGGTALLLLARRDSPADAATTLATSTPGVIMAFAAAFIWSSYSVASRLYAGVPSSAVVVACGATTLGATLLHSWLEQTVAPVGFTAWFAVLALGLGPVGIAFYVWDEGVKRGDIRLLGVASYATPLISTAVLAALGLGSADGVLWISAALIAGGALLASADKFRQG